MKKTILSVGIITLFIGMVLAPTVASMQADPVETIKTISNNKYNGPGWRYILFGRIKSYELKEHDGEEYLECKAIRVNSIWWNVLDKFPNLPLPMNLRFGQMFNIPCNGAKIKIIGPTLLGHYFIIAKGVLE